MGTSRRNKNKSLIRVNPKLFKNSKQAQHGSPPAGHGKRDPSLSRLILSLTVEVDNNVTLWVEQGVSKLQNFSNCNARLRTGPAGAVLSQGSATDGCRMIFQFTPWKQSRSFCSLPTRIQIRKLAFHLHNTRIGANSYSNCCLKHQDGCNGGAVYLRHHLCSRMYVKDRLFPSLGYKRIFSRSASLNIYNIFPDYSPFPNSTLTDGKFHSFE